VVTLILAGVTTLYVGCSDKSGREASSAQDGTGSGTATPIQDVVQFTIDTLPQLAGGMPLGAWRREHASDAIEPHAPRLATPPNEHWCARATSSPSKGPSSTRVAYFYRPASAASSPPSTPGSDARTDDCRLGLLWTDIGGDHAGAVADVTQQVMVNTLGDPDPPIALHWPDSASWSRTAHWRLGRMSIVTGVSRGSRASSAGDASRVFVAAAGEASRLRFDTAGSRVE
jgi:hypothetical protein